MVRGTVKSWNDDDGWGVLVSPDAPADVSFDYERVPGGQDGYDLRATRIVSGQD
jgi:cold shock CspA family protein